MRNAHSAPQIPRPLCADRCALANAFAVTMSVGGANSTVRIAAGPFVRGQSLPVWIDKQRLPTVNTRRREPLGIPASRMTLKGG